MTRVELTPEQLRMADTLRMLRKWGTRIGHGSSKWDLRSWWCLDGKVWLHDRGVEQVGDYFEFMARMRAGELPGFERS